MSNRRASTFGAVRALLEYEVGNFSQGEVFLELATEPTVDPPLGEAGLLLSAEVLTARIAGVERPIDAREKDARNAISLQLSPAAEATTRAGLALTAVLRGDVQEAAEHYPALEPQRGTMIEHFWMVMAADHLLGVLAHTMGDRDNASGHFEDALAFCRKAGYKPELAWTSCDYADLLLDPRMGGSRTAHTSAANHEKAMALLDEGVSIARELGMRPLVERMEALREQAEAQPATAPAYPDGLTEREVEVLQLVAAGRTNREIAEALFISLRTVTNHVTNILNKTDAANRAEAATYANRHDLV